MAALSGSAFVATPIPAQPRVASPALTPTPASRTDLGKLTGKVKGTLLIARMKFVRSRGDTDSERVLKRLSAEDQAVLRASLLPSSWYPVGVLMRLEMTAAAILAKGDRKALFLEMGRFTATTNLAPDGMQRAFLREGDPHFLLNNLPRIYSSQHSTGRRMYERTGPTTAVVRHFDSDEADADDCLTVVGWLQKAVELSGGHGVIVDEVACRGRGAPHCEFRVRWS